MSNGWEASGRWWKPVDVAFAKGFASGYADAARLDEVHDRHQVRSEAAQDAMSRHPYDIGRLVGINSFDDQRLGLVGTREMTHVQLYQWLERNRWKPS